MYLLDTDHISLMDRGGAEGERIRLRLARIPPDDVYASIISYEEQVRGWMSAIAHARTSERQILFYGELERLLRFYCVTPMLSFDSSASAEFERHKMAGVRIGTLDLKIAAIAISKGARVLTRNLSDFQKVPGLLVEDWSV